MANYCRFCGDDINPQRYRLGYGSCLDCGERLARKRKHTVVPMHKSNYQVVTNRDILQWLNKG